VQCRALAVGRTNACSHVLTRSSARTSYAHARQPVNPNTSTNKTLTSNPRFCDLNTAQPARAVANMPQTLYPRGTVKKIIKAHSARPLSKNVDILVRHTQFPLTTPSRTDFASRRYISTTHCSCKSTSQAFQHETERIRTRGKWMYARHVQTDMME
jgi:hypothetical protein